MPDQEREKIARRQEYQRRRYQRQCDGEAEACTVWGRARFSLSRGLPKRGHEPVSAFGNGLDVD